MNRQDVCNVLNKRDITFITNWRLRVYKETNLDINFCELDKTGVKIILFCQLQYMAN